MQRSCPAKIIFFSYSGKYCFFRKNCYMKSIQNRNTYKKGCIDFCRQTPPRLKTVGPPTNSFLHFFPKILLFPKNLFHNKTSVTKFVIKKIILIFCFRSPLSLKNGQMRPQNSFVQFPQKILLFPKKL